MKNTLHNVAAGLHNRLLDNDLDEEGRRWLADHRAACSACDASFAAMERVMAALSSLERPEPSPAFADRVLAELRPAPVPVWARWQIRGWWGRAAAAATLVAAGLVALVSPDLAEMALRQAGGPGTLVSGPGLLADAMVGLIRQLEPFGALGELVTVLGQVAWTVASSPQVLTALGALALMSLAAFLQLSHVLVAPQRRRSSHA